MFVFYTECDILRQYCNLWKRRTGKAENRRGITVEMRTFWSGDMESSGFALNEKYEPSFFSFYCFGMLSVTFKSKIILLQEL